MTHRIVKQPFPCPHCKYLLVNDVDGNGMLRCPECGTESFPADVAEQRKARMHRTRLLWFSLAVYLIVNAFFIGLAARGVIHPPWGVLGFFSFFGPSIASALILITQFATRGRAFHWVAVCLIMALFVLTSVANLCMYGEALAAV